MIALLVLSIGLLGLASLQAASARFGQDAYIRSTSTLITSDIIDRIRMNSFERNDAADQNIALYASTTPANNCDPNLSSISNDLACWQRSIEDQLPGGTGTIVDNPDGSFTVAISWYDRDGDATKSYSWTYVPPPRL
jgi:type IV pilus assembly protein PilV